MKLIIGIAGASGVIYGIKLLEALKSIKGIETHLVLTNTAKMNISIETDFKPLYVESLADFVHKNSNIGASIASGSFKVDGMIVAACAMKTLSSIVHSHADNLLVRAADVTLKENRKLVLMPRETPMHIGHCKLMYEAALMGAIIAPPIPAFYGKPTTIDGLINHSVGRVLDLFDIETDIINRWQGANA